ncbi:MAG: hypothetical protein WA087_01165 [Candidatus Saccharimonadales bacterium]
MRLLRISLSLAAIIMISGFVVTRVNAQAIVTNAAQGIEISPTLVELNASKGKTYNLTLKVMNVTASDLVYSSLVNDFDSADESGSPYIILDSKLPATASIITWVDEIPQFTLTAHKSRVVNVNVTIPNDAEPGGHYGVISFSGTTPELSGNSVGLNASAGVLLLIRVDGAITEKAGLASFYSALNDKQSSFFENSPITFVTRIKNEGNIYIKPIGNIEIRDMFGNFVTKLSVGDDQSNVLPSSIRRFETQYKSGWMIGRYTANLTLGYGTTGQAITGTIYFWVIPYKLILIVLFMLGTIIYILSRMIKVYNRHIIEKAKNESSINQKHKNAKN